MDIETAERRRTELRVETYRKKRALLSRQYDHYWRVVHLNSNILADSAQGYARKEDRDSAIALLWPDIRIFRVDD